MEMHGKTSFCFMENRVLACVCTLPKEIFPVVSVAVQASPPIENHHCLELLHFPVSQKEKADSPKQSCISVLCLRNPSCLVNTCPEYLIFVRRCRIIVQ